MNRAEKNCGEAANWKHTLMIIAMAASFLAYLLCSRAVPIFWQELTRLVGKL